MSESMVIGTLSAKCDKCGDTFETDDHLEMGYYGEVYARYAVEYVVTEEGWVLFETTENKGGDYEYKTETLYCSECYNNDELPENTKVIEPWADKQ